MEINNAIFQVLENFGKKRVFKLAMESFGFLHEKMLKYPIIDILCHSKHDIYYVILDTIYIVYYYLQHNPLQTQRV